MQSRHSAMYSEATNLASIYDVEFKRHVSITRLLRSVSRDKREGVSTLLPWNRSHTSQ
jgi:hypothetical protein